MMLKTLCINRTVSYKPQIKCLHPAVAIFLRIRKIFSCIWPTFTTRWYLQNIHIHSCNIYCMTQPQSEIHVYSLWVNSNTPPDCWLLSEAFSKELLIMSLLKKSNILWNSLFYVFNHIISCWTWLWKKAAQPFITSRLQSWNAQWTPIQSSQAHSLYSNTLQSVVTDSVTPLLPRKPSLNPQVLPIRIQPWPLNQSGLLNILLD